MLKNQNQLLTIFLLLSLLLAGVTTYYLSKNTYKYNIVNQEEVLPKGFSYIYYDFNKDGNSEKFLLANYEKTSTSAVQYMKEEKIIRQFNFVHPLEIRTISFSDYNGDNFDEMILFTKKGNSLYLSIIDLLTVSYILHEELIFKRTPINDYKEWDYSLRSAQFIKTMDGKRKLLFSLNSGFAFYPRGIYLYDVEKKEITNRFENEAAKIGLSLIDLNNNGYKEIIVNGMAPGNGSPFSKYSDHYSWLFVLDNELNLFWQPQKMTSHPSSYYAYPFKSSDKSYLLSSCFGSKNVDDWIGLRILDENGKNVNQLKITNDKLSGIVKIINETGKTFFVTTTKNGYARLYDFNLNLLSDEKISNRFPSIVDAIDIENDGVEEYLFHDKSFLILTDDNFNIIAKHKHNIYLGCLSDVSYKKSNNSNLVIGSRTENHYNLLSFHKSNIFASIPYLFPIFTTFIFGFLFFVHRVGQQISRHYSVYNYFIEKDSSALMIFSPNGKIKEYNFQFQTLLGVNNPIFKNDKLKELFGENKTLLSIINDSIKDENETKTEFETITNKMGTITITPIKSMWGFVYAYLFEFSDITEPIFSDRQKLWSKTSQKIAHDIKTPLSTIQLNLAALNKRIDEESITKKEGFKDDISMIRSEVNRIRSLTQGFLKFANLEKPNMQIINVADIIEKALQQFNSYTKNGVKIATSFQDIDTTVIVDPLQIEQLFHIIIENSIDSMEGKGIIEIKTELAQKMNYQSFLQIEFSDNGKGIEEEKVNQIFEPYFTTKKDGTGLGLAIAKKIVEDNNGEISIYSKLGLGTTVTLLLPMADE